MYIYMYIWGWGFCLLQRHAPCFQINFNVLCAADMSYG